MARNLILYFSGTGNSLAAAKRIAKEIGDTDIRPMAAFPNPEGEYERVGFVFPCYAAGLPRFVKNYINSLDTEKLISDYFFAVETYGGWPGNSNTQLNKILQSKGEALSFAINIKMFSNYIALYAMKDNEKDMAKEADVELSSVAVSIRKKMRNSATHRAFLMGIFYSIGLPAMLKKVKDFHVSDDCISCNKCVQLCPTENIRMEAGKPNIGLNCEQCMACIQWCPMQAINYKTKTVGKKRYTHPAINISEMYLRD
jgi:ferredoxin/flavodoxin